MRARTVLDKMSREGVAPDVQSFTQYAKGLVASGDPDGAAAVLDDMQAAGVAPNQVRCGMCCHSRRLPRRPSEGHADDCASNLLHRPKRCSVLLHAAQRAS